LSKSFTEFVVRAFGLQKTTKCQLCTVLEDLKRMFSGNSFGNNSSGGSGSFGGGSNPFGGGDSTGSPTGGGAPNSDTNPDSELSSSEGDQQSGDDLNELLGASPFGRLLDIPGIDGVEDIFGNVGGGAGGGSPFGGGGAGGFGGGAPSEDGDTSGENGGAPSGNPFANFDPLQEGNPFIEGDEPNISFGGGAGGSPFGGGGGGSPFGGGGTAGGGSPFGGASSGVSDEGSFAIGDADEYVLRNENGEWFVSDDDVVSEEDTSLTNPDMLDVDGISETDDAPADGTFPVGQVPEGLSNEELAVSSEVADSEDAPAEDSGSSGGNPMESSSNYNWDFNWDSDFPGSGSPNQDAPASDSGAPELVDGNLAFEGLGLEIPLLDEEGNIDPPVGSVFPNGEGIEGIPADFNVPVNEEGESLSFSQVVINGEEIDFDSLTGIPADVAAFLGEDNMLQLPGGVIDLSNFFGEAVPEPTPEEAGLTVGLYNADSDELIAPLKEGTQIQASEVAGKNLTISASVPEDSVYFEQVESIFLNLNDGQVTKTENFEPYALFGDNEGSDLYGGINLQGDNTIAFELYSHDKLGGNLLDTLTVDFVIA
jgi:hypothetical protein